MSLVPNHRERQFMQRLRGRGWVNAIELPENFVTLQRLLEKRWIESQGKGRDARVPDHGRGYGSEEGASAALRARDEGWSNRADQVGKQSAANLREMGRLNANVGYFSFLPISLCSLSAGDPPQQAIRGRLRSGFA